MRNCRAFLTDAVLIVACFAVARILVSSLVREDKSSSRQLPGGGEVQSEPKECLGTQARAARYVESAVLLSEDDADCVAARRPIFFLETDMAVSRFSGRKLCAFESTAKANPERPIVSRKKHRLSN